MISPWTFAFWPKSRLARFFVVPIVLAVYSVLGWVGGTIIRMKCNSGYHEWLPEKNETRECSWCGARESRCHGALSMEWLPILSSHEEQLYKLKGRGPVYCKNCAKYFSPNIHQRLCSALSSINLVIGGESCKTCEAARAVSGGCGPGGILYTPLNPEEFDEQG